MAATCGQEEASEKKPKKKAKDVKKNPLKPNSVIIGRNKGPNNVPKGSAKSKKAKIVKHSFIASMAVIEDKVVDAYLKQEIKKKRYNEKMKQKKEKKSQEKDVKMSPEEKKSYDNNTKDNETSGVDTTLLLEKVDDNAIESGDAKEDVMEKNEQKTNDVLHPTDAAIAMLHFSQKALKEKKSLPKMLYIRSMQNNKEKKERVTK